MGLLDELREEAETARRRREAESARHDAHEAGTRARLEPVMQRVEQFFRELTTHLRELNRSRAVAYDLPDVGRLQGLEQAGYRAGWTEQAGRRRFVVSFRCTGKRGLEARMDGEPRAAAAERLLRGAGLRTHRGRQGRAGVSLLVAADVPVSLAFECDTDDGAVVLSTRNLLELGERSYRFAPEQVSDELLDAIGLLVLGQREDFDRLTGNTVDEARRRDMARQLARERRRRNAELAGPLWRAVFPLTEWFRRTFRGG